MARNTSVNVGVNFVPNTSQLDSALKQFNNVDLQTKVTGISGDVLAPFRQSVEDLNAAMASGRGENEIAQLMDRVKTEANAARASLDAATAGIKAFYDSPVNQDNLKAIAEIDAKLESATNQLKQWNKNKSALNELRKLASDNNFDINTTARGRLKQIKDIEALRDAQGNLNEEFQTQIDLIRRYQTISNELRTTRKGDIESNIRNLTLSREGLLANTVTPEMLTNFTTSAAMTGSQVTSQENDILNRIPSYTQNLQKMAKASDEARGKVKELGDTFAASFLGFSLSNILEDAVRGAQQFFTAYDETLTRTQMVTGMTRDEVMSLTSAYAELADELSSTISAVAEAQLVFYQQGLSTEDSLAMTEASIAISKTGGIEAGEAADRLTAAVNGYQLAASDAMDIADKMSALDAAAASSVDELTVAMQKSASQARMAGLDLDYYMAYLSTMQEVTREAPENIGTAMKSITSRIQEITDIGKVEEDGTTFSNVAEALNSIGIAALDTQGQLRPLQEILNELGPMWATLDRNHQAYIATVLAGNRQQSRFIALMDNYDRALELVDISQNSTGESARQLRAYDEGLESSLIGLQNAWQQFATSLVDSDMIKTVVDALTSLIEVVNAIPDGLLQIVAGLAAVSAAYKTISAIKKPEFRAWFNDTGLGRIITAFRGISTTNNEVTGEVERSWKTTTSNIGKFVVAMVNRINQALVGIKSSTGLETEKKQVDALNTSISSNSKIRQQNSVAQIQSNANNAVEIDTTRQLANEQGILSNNYGTSVNNINAQKDAMDKNDPTMEKEISDVQRLSNVQDVPRMLETNQEELNKVRAAQRSAIDNFNQQRAVQREAYERIVKDPDSWKEGGELYSMAQNELASRGITPPVGQLSFESLDELEVYKKKLNKEMGKLSKEFGKGYHQMVEGEYRPAFKEEMRILKAQEKGLLDERSRLGQIRADITKGTRNTSSPNSKNTNFVPKDKKEQKAYAKNTLAQFAAQGDYSIGSLKTLFSDKSLTLVNKFRGALSGVNVAGGLMVKTLGQMALSAIGFSDDLSEGLSTTAGLATSLASFGVPGIAAGIAIGVVTTAFDMLTVSAEEARAKLEEINAEQDELTQRNSNIENALESYRDLSANVARTEEEQQQLNDTTAQLADLIPEAVAGYDDMGNAIINVARAQEELNQIARDNLRLAREEMSSINDLQEAEDGWDFTRWLIEGLPWNWNNEQTYQDVQREDRASVANEYAADITDYFTTLRDSYLEDMNEAEQELFRNISNSFQQMVSDRIYTTSSRQMQVDDAAKMYENLLDTYANNLDIGRFQDIIEQLEYTFDYGNYTFSQAADMAREQLTSMLSAAGYNAEEIEQIINVVLDITIDGGGEFVNALETIRSEMQDILDIPVEDRTVLDKTYFRDLQNLYNSMGNLSTEDFTALSDAGFIDRNASNLVNNLFGGDLSNIADLARDENGNIDFVNYGNQIRDRIYQAEEAVNLKLDEAKLLRQESQAILESAGIEDWSTYLLGEQYGLNLNPELKEAITNYQNAGYAIEYYNGQLSAQQNILSNMAYEVPEEPSFGDMATTLGEVSSEMETVVSLMDELDESEGKLSSGNVQSMFEILDNLEQKVSDGILDSDLWSRNLDILANSFSVVNGELQMSESGREAILQLQEESVKATYREVLATLDANEAVITNQKTLMEAYRSSLMMELNRLEQEKAANYDAGETKKNISKNLSSYLSEQTWAQVQDTADALSEELAVYGQFYTELSNMRAQYEEGETITWGDLEAENSSTYERMLEDISSRYDTIITDNYDQTIQNIKNEIDLADAEIARWETALDGIQTKRVIAEYILSNDVDLSSFLGGAEEATEELDEYNEQLERTLTLLEKIEGIQHKIDENDAFRDLYEGYNGARRGELLGENLRLYEEQFDYYKQLFDMQQEMTNQAAGDLLDSMYGDMFTIAENGDIGWATTEMYDKYKGLPDDMQEDIDNLVQAFQEQRDALRDTENELLNYAEATKEAREEIVDLIEETEDLILQTIQDREEVLHDARIKALEDEIEMIEEAVEARNDAREEQDNAEDLFNAQEALRRATLDSSGKNNATLLQLQQDLEDKQQEISEKRFEDDMDARKEYLQAIIDAENETYEYRLETMTWYWEQVELMQEQSTQAIMDFLMTWNNEYLTESQIGQEELMREWQSTFEELNAVMQDQMTDNINDLKNQFLDLASGVEAIDVNVQALAGSWEKVYENASKANSVSSSGGGSSYRPSGGGGSGLKYYTQYTGSQGQKINEDALTDGKVDESKVFTSTKDNYGTYYMPNNVDGSKVHKTGVTAGDLGLDYNSSKVGIKNQAVWKSDAGQYYVWNGTLGKYEKVTSLFAKYGNNGFGALSSTATGGYGYSVYKGSKTVPSLSQVRDALKALGASRYAFGGLVDYTGPAWVDGTSSRPEAFLSSYQTEQIGALAKALDSSSVSTVSNSSNVTFGAITFNVASMSSAADGRKALDTFVKGANEMMAKKGVNTTLNLNYK